MVQFYKSQPGVNEMHENTRTALIVTGILVLALLLAVGAGFLTRQFCIGEVNEVPEVNNLTAVGSQVIACNCTLQPFCRVTRPCPKEPAESCLINPLMPTPPEPEACLVPCQPQCTQENCRKPPPSPCPYVKAQPTKKSSFFQLTEEQMMSKTVLEWVMTYPPNSYERLQVLTQLMEFGVERYVRQMSRRNCEKPYKLCTMCNDRFEYLKCAMRMRITANKLGYKETYKLSRIPSTFLEEYAYNAYWHGTNGGYLKEWSSQGLINAFEAFWFVNDSGEECTWCSADSNPWKHNDCIYQPY